MISQSISLHLFAQPQSPPHQFIWEHNSTNCDVDPHTRVEAAHFEDSWGNCAECSRIFTGVLAYGQWVAGTGDHRRGRFVQYAYAHEHACTPTQFPTMKLHCTTRPLAPHALLLLTLCCGVPSNIVDFCCACSRKCRGRAYSRWAYLHCCGRAWEHT